MNPITTAELVAKLRKQQIILRLEGDDQLRLAGITLSEDLLNEVRSHKPALVEFLKKHSSSLAIPLETVSIRTPGSPQYVETSLGQTKEYVLHRIKDDGSFFNLQFVLSTEDIPEEVLMDLLQTIVARHEALRTSFEVVDGVLMQVIHPGELVGVNLRYVDLDASSDVDETMNRLARQENETPFNFHQPPLWRILGFRQHGQRRSFLFTFHHVIADHASLRLLRDELAALYGAYLADQPNRLKPVRAQYRDYIIQKNRLINREPHHGFWKSQLAAGLTPLSIVDPSVAEAHRRERNRLFDEAKKRFNQTGLTDDTCLYECVDRLSTPDGGAVQHSFDESLVSQLEAMATQAQLSLFSLLAGAIGLLFHWLGGQQRLVFTFPVGARHQEAYADLFGWVTGSAVCSITLEDENQSISAYLRELNEQITQAYEYSDYPFQILYKEMGIPPDQWIPVALNYIDFDGSRIPSEFTQRPNQSNGCVAYHDLSFEFGRYADGLTMTMYYRTRFFSATAAQRLVHTYSRILTSLVDQDQLPVSAFKSKSSLTF